MSDEKKVPYVDLPAHYAGMRQEILDILDRMHAQGRFILRGEVAEFETAMGGYLGVPHVVGVNSGTDALFLALHALGVGPGDEVITVAHTFVATVAAIVHHGATPVLIDIGADHNLDPARLEAAITPRTKAVIPVHMNGRMCDMAAILAIARRHGLKVVEDTAQGLGAKRDGRMAGTVGDIGCFSLHPMKNLSVGGDGGFITTRDPALDATLRCLRNHGQRSKDDLACFGFNSRLDNIHAAVALAKLPHLPRWLERRRALASRYSEALAGVGDLCLSARPRPETDGPYDVFSSYVITSGVRDALVAHLRASGIEIFIHWQVPLHRQPGLRLGGCSLPNTEALSRNVFSLPVQPELSDQDQSVVIDAVRAFFRK